MQDTLAVARIVRVTNSRDRLNQFYELDWSAQPYRYGDAEYGSLLGSRTDLIVSGVDSRAARCALHVRRFDGHDSARFGAHVAGSATLVHQRYGGRLCGAIFIRIVFQTVGSVEGRTVANVQQAA
ncbi:MAG TPA: hypothetical protein VF450_08545 [Noviherbaspirillum sp.]